MKARIGIMMFGVMAGGWLFSACSEREGGWPEEEGGRISVSAAVDRMESRAGGEVTGGTFVLAYDSVAGKDALAKVPFEGKTGFPLVATRTADVYRMLDWGDVVSTGGSYVFTLDNIDNMEDAKTVALGETYDAQAEEGARNDILWGKLTVSSSESKTENLKFRLSHRMAKVSVIVTSETSDISLDGNVTVKLLDIKTGAASFNRETGAVAADAGVPAGSITLLDDQPLSEGGEAATPAWIVPPQTFVNTRPTLEITVNGETYSGQLGTYMVYGSSGEKGDPAELAFEAGRCLKIKATLSKDVAGTRIIFMPVMVEDWEDVGSISIVASQTGVYDEEDYEELVTAYNDNKDETILSKYGDKDGEKWTFRIFADIGKGQSLPENLRFGDDDFDISFNAHSVYGVTDKDYLRTPGVYDEEDYSELVETYNSDKPDDEKAKILKKYGTYEEASAQWTFSLKNDVGSADTEIPENLKFGDNNFSMDFNTYTIYGESDCKGLIKEDTGTEKGGIRS